MHPIQAYEIAKGITEDRRRQAEIARVARISRRRPTVRPKRIRRWRRQGQRALEPSG